MASLATQFSTFLFLCPVGIHRLLCSSSLYLKNPSLYRSKPWFFSEPRWKNIDFYTLLVALPIASFSDIFFFLTLTGNPTYRFAFLQQSAVVSLFWVLTILIIFREYFDPCAIPENFVFTFAGITFLIEYMLMGRGITGLGGAVFGLLGGLTLLCGVSCLYLSVWPSAYFAEFLLSLGLVLKGTWGLQSGLSLFTDAFALKGCDKISLYLAPENTDVKCALEEDRLRGIAVVNLLFVLHSIGVLIVGFVLYGLLNLRNSKFGEASGSLLAELGPESSMQTHPHFELE